MNQYVMTLVKAGVFGALLATAGAAFAQSAEEEFRAMTDAWAEAYHDGDAATVAELYAEDTRWVTSTGETYRSRAGAQAFVEALLGMGLAEVEITIDELAADESLGWNAGSYVFFDAEGEQASAGRYFITYERHEGAWRIAHHVSSPPEPEEDDAN